MKKIWEEILFDIKGSSLLFVLLFAQLTIFFTVSFFSEQLKKEVSATRQEPEINAQSELAHYYILDNLVGEYEKAFLKDKDAVGKLKIMYAKLKNNPHFEYLEMYNNPIVLIGDNIKEEMLYMYEYGEAANYRGVEEGEIFNEVKAFWMSCNVNETFDLPYQEGAMWTEEEKNGHPVPIVLGSEYADAFHAGDMIQGLIPVNYMEKITFKVHGILKEGANVIHKGRVLNLDRYALIPLQDAKSIPATKDERSEQIVLYMFKINGTLVSQATANELQTLIQDICDTSGVTPSSTVSEATNSQSYVLNESVLDIWGMLEKMLIMLSVFSMIATILYVILKIEKSKKYYSILMLNGFSIAQVMLILCGSLMLLLFLSELLSWMIYYVITFFFLEAPQTPWHIILAYPLGILLPVGVISYVRLKRLDIGFYIGGQE